MLFERGSSIDIVFASYILWFKFILNLVLSIIFTIFVGMKNVPGKILDYIKDLNNKESFEVLTTDMGFTAREAGDILNVYIFEDLQFKSHRVVPDAVQSTLNFGDKFISVVGGGEGLYGNGKTTFEVLTSEADDVEGHIGKKRVTEILLELQEDNDSN